MKSLKALWGGVRGGFWVVVHHWWTASDVPKELTFQLWLKMSEKYMKDAADLSKHWFSEHPEIEE